MTGSEIKQLILSEGVRCWQVAELWGISDGNFSRRLRKPFDDDETEKVRACIQRIKAEGKSLRGN